jgi:thiamine-phosphate pyrophosphorylase
VQLRWKGGPDRLVAELARQLRGALTVPVLVNDRLDIALATGCAGVHLGHDDLPIASARKVTHPGFIVGASVGDPNEAAASLGADYVGIGPWRATTTKEDAGPGLGAEGLTRLVAMVQVPAIVIGGIRPTDVHEIRALGVAGIAVASGILSAPNAEAAVGSYLT